jgi:LytS/YehU family sensor histidine kinase
MMIQDLFGFIRRNIKKLSKQQVQKMLTEINQIKSYLERVLKEMEKVA